jgi:nicotinate dehydrogenase subunit A
MAIIALTVNGARHTVDVEPDTPLLYVLSDEMGLGQCGSCTAIVNGRAIRSCVTPVSSIGASEVTTLEGLGTIERPHPIQQAFIDEQAAQCGYCLDGVILTAKALLDERPNASLLDIKQALSGVLCRCFVNLRMLKAIERYRAQSVNRRAASRDDVEKPV